MSAGQRLHIDSDTRLDVARALVGSTRVVDAQRAPAGPTRTKTIQDAYEAEMYRRFRAIKGLVRTTVEANDALRLGERGDRRDRGGPGTVASADASIATNADPVQDFDFPRDDEKIQAFLRWLREAEDDEVLEVFQRSGREVVARSEWQNIYVRRSYAKGLEQAEEFLQEQGIDVPEQRLGQIFNLPVHADALGILYTRNFTELEGISEAMDQQISRELVDGFAQGWNPRKMATEINDRVDNVGLTRARTLARTETINAHAEGTLNRYQDIMGPDAAVTIRAEWSTAGDDRVCPICISLEGEIFSLEEARGLIPIHPNCRCAWLPVTSADESSQRALGEAVAQADVDLELEADAETHSGVAVDDVAVAVDAPIAS